MTESPQQQTPNQEMASSTNTDFVLIPDHIHPKLDVPKLSVFEQFVPEPDVPQLSDFVLIPDHI